jgi:hypothetical protein
VAIRCHEDTVATYKLVSRLSAMGVGYGHILYWFASQTTPVHSKFRDYGGVIWYIMQLDRDTYCVDFKT